MDDGDHDRREGEQRRAEGFLTMNRIGEMKRLEATVVSLDGVALNWFQ